MRIFLGFLMLLGVSGDNHTDVKGFLNESVLLPCFCEDRTSDSPPRWQKEPAISLNNSPSYSDRIELFPTDRNNCSILLKNIREDDNGTYKCIYDQNVYQHIYVHLSVCVNSKPEDTVSRHVNQGDSTENKENSVSISVTIVFVGLILGVGLLLFWCYRKNITCR